VRVPAARESTAPAAGPEAAAAKAAATAVAVIPARWASTRFPGKPLAALHGKPVVQHVLERARAAAVFDAVWVATDDERIAAVVRAAGGEARLTRPEHATGTERVAEAAAALPPDAVVLNVQGDEPLVPPELLRDLVQALQRDPAIDIVTAAHWSEDAAGFASPHVVKVVIDAAGRALYFSRCGIPHAAPGTAQHYLRHIGIYGFRRRILSQFVQLPRGPLEAREGLEQLRALENGLRIHVLVTTHETLGVDTPEDLKAVALRLGAA
jgi:3-deoxy-manno-octulosonate cytidylyltransferase (CMP-KDO synthetase)